MNKFGNKTIEMYNEYISSGMSSSEVYDKLLKNFVRRTNRKTKIEKLFNLKCII